MTNATTTTETPFQRRTRNRRQLVEEINAKIESQVNDAYADGYKSAREIYATEGEHAAADFEDDGCVATAIKAQMSPEAAKRIGATIETAMLGGRFSDDRESEREIAWFRDQLMTLVRGV